MKLGIRLIPPGLGWHATAPELVQLLDGEQIRDRGRVAGHVARCRSCSERLDRLARRSAGLSTLLRTVPVPARSPSIRLGVAKGVRPPAPTGTDLFGARMPWAPLAAAVLAVAGVSAATLASGSYIPSLMAVPEVSLAPAVARPPVRPDPWRMVWFEPRPHARHIVVRLDEAPASGELYVARVARLRKVGAQIVADGHGETITIDQGEVIVRNLAASQARYRLLLTRDIDRVYVRVAGSNRTKVIGVGPRIQQPLRLGPDLVGDPVP